jgi:hypothetical protein
MVKIHSFIFIYFRVDLGTEAKAGHGEGAKKLREIKAN